MSAFRKEDGLVASHDWLFKVSKSGFSVSEWHRIKMANHKISRPLLETVFFLWTIMLSQLHFYKVPKHKFIQP